jgi:hypothetical protein
MFKFLLIIPLLAYLAILACLISYVAVRRTKLSAVPLAGFLALPVCLIFLSWLLSIKTPDRDDITGQYEIARSKWPSKNADWQLETYTLEITDSHAIVRDARTKTVWKYRIEWSGVNKHYWSFADSTKRHHIIDNGPTLYRGRFGHHYVFRSSLYGNVFFEKEWPPDMENRAPKPPLP